MHGHFAESKRNYEMKQADYQAAINQKKAESDLAYDLLWKKHRLAIAMTPEGDSEGLRFSPHIYNNFEEIDRALAAVRELSG